MTVRVAAASLLLSIAACGGDTDTGSGGSGGSGAAGGSGSGGSGGGCELESELDDPACLECVSANCEAEYADCAGPAWQEGSFEGGKCEAFYACLEACCGDSACNSGCFGEISPACQSCIEDGLACKSASCGDVCK